MKQGTLDESRGPGGSYSERCLDVGVTLEMSVLMSADMWFCDVTAAAKNNQVRSAELFWVMRGKFDSTAHVGA